MLNSWIKPASERLSSCFDVAAGFFYPSKCALCGTIGRQSPCRTCRAEFCRQDTELSPPQGALYRTVAVFPYIGKAKQAVHQLKFSRSTSLARFMTSELVAAADRLGFVDDDILAVPVHYRRLNSRGFNQSDLLVEGFPKDRILNGLIRTRATIPQAMLPPMLRAQNVIGVFEAHPSVEGRAILLIDDVCTTGYTAHECARELLRKGAATVSMLAFSGGRELLR